MSGMRFEGGKIDLLPRDWEFGEAWWKVGVQFSGATSSTLVLCESFSFNLQAAVDVDSVMDILRSIDEQQHEFRSLIISKLKEQKSDPSKLHSVNCGNVLEGRDGAIFLSWHNLLVDIDKVLINRDGYTVNAQVFFGKMIYGFGYQHAMILLSDGRVEECSIGNVMYWGG